jgi:hypothetical protein
MMNVLGIYDEDLSLFNGDLLDFAPGPVESDFAQDGLKSSEYKTAVLGQDVPSLEQSIMGFPEPFDQTWLDTKVDLLDYLAGHVSSGIEEMPSAPSLDVKTEQDPSSNAIQVLQDVADETMAMLTSDFSEDQQQDPADKASIDILEMLAAQLTDDRPFIEVEMFDDSSILSPVTPEDVESLLSSGPNSPSVELSPDSSFETSYHGEQLVTVDLAQLLSQVQDQQQELMLDSSIEEFSDDPTYDPLDDICTESFRSKPVERKTKKSTSTAKLPKEAKQLDRKLRKKQQNKDAATRYREKKRQEQQVVFGECDQLENRNVELKATVEQMTREMSYLKNLLVEVYEAKGLLKKCK